MKNLRILFAAFIFLLLIGSGCSEISSSRVMNYTIYFSESNGAYVIYETTQYVRLSTSIYFTDKNGKFVELFGGTIRIEAENE